jgi:hypothetical protein
MNPEIHLHIERLILDGLALQPGEERLLSAALQGELTRLLAEGDLAQLGLAGTALPELRAAPIQTGPRPDPAGLGRQIAGSVFGSMGGDRE